MLEILKEIDKKYKNIIGQLEHPLTLLEGVLDDDDYKDACDSAYTYIAYLKLACKKEKDEVKLNKNE
jgi:hypothetical protein